MKKMICLFAVIAMLFVACTDTDGTSSASSAESKTDAENTYQTVSSIIVSSGGQEQVEIKYKSKIVSPDGQYTLYNVNRDDPNWMSRGTVKLRNNNNNDCVTLFDYVGYVEKMEFLTNQIYHVLTGRQYIIYDVSGQVLFDVSDYLTTGESTDGTDYLLLRCCFIGKEKIVFTFLDRNNVTDGYKIGVFDGNFKTINTGKVVEGDSFYISPMIEIVDENTILLYSTNRADERTFEIMVNLTTGQSIITDYRK